MAMTACGTGRLSPEVVAGSRSRPRRGAGTRSGHSLIELTLGILLLDVGVLALTATAAGIVGMTASGAREGGSALVAAGRLERLQASACSDTVAAQGAETAGPYDVRWTVGGDASLRTVLVLVTWRGRTGIRSVPYETVVACPS